MKQERLYVTVCMASFAAESYDRCVVLIRANDEKYLCLEVPVSARYRNSSRYRSFSNCLTQLL